MLELLNQLDGFDSRGEVKVIMATNRIEALDPALIRPGRIDRKIEFPLPDMQTKRNIFKIHTSRMTVSDDVDFEEFCSAKDDLSGADVKAMCTEAGLLALRERRMKVTHRDYIYNSHGTEIFVSCERDTKCLVSFSSFCLSPEQVTQKDFIAAKETALYKKKDTGQASIYL
jgi:ATP-dependent 26S proteasome regulatory subunit